MSVSVVTLLAPGISVVVIAANFPETGFVMVEDPEPGDPFSALPEVEVRHDHAGRSTVLSRERFAFRLPHHQRFPAEHFVERKVGRVTGVGEGHYVGR
jgi:hypothetical protein